MQEEVTYRDTPCLYSLGAMNPEVTGSGRGG